MYQSICSSKGCLKSQPCYCFGVSAPPCFCIYLFPSNCRSHAVLTWPGTGPGTSSARPSPGIASPEKPPAAETGAQRRGRGPCVLIPCCRASPISPAPIPPPRSFVRAVPVLLVPRGERPCAMASSSAGDPRPVLRCSRGPALPEPRPFPRWSLRVCARVSTWRHLHFALLQSACAASEEENKWCKGIYIPSERGCWSVRFHLLPRGAGV